MRKIVSDFDNEWSAEILEEVYETIEKIAVGEWGYDIYPNQIEIISSDGMLEAYASSGLPVMYHHWSYGKRYLSQSKLYKAGLMGLAYEIVINSNPCISYLMEGNTLAMQTLVLSHAAFGHNHFFKNNYLFKQWTQPEAIIDYLGYAKRYISRCEDRHGIDAVESIIDAAHAISHYSVDKYHRVKKTKGQLEDDLRRRIEWEDAQYDPLVNPFRPEKKSEKPEEMKVEPTENLLYFIEKQAPNLQEWQREVIRIVRKIGQYFYPQGQLQMMNEGFATATHYEMSWELYNRGYVDDAYIGEFIHKHSGVLYSEPTTKGSPLKYLNPYKLGFEMYMDIKRRCQNPTKEDEFYFPEQVGRPYRDVWFEAINSYKDESFIEQYLSPETVRKMQLISIFDSDSAVEYKVSGTSSDESFKHIRKYLSRQYDFGSRFPQISIHDVDWKGNRRLHLRHDMQNRRPLDGTESKKVLMQVHKLWQFPVSIDSHDSTGTKNYQVYPT